MIYSENDNI